MNKPLDLKVETERRGRADYVLSRTDKYFTKSRQIVEKFGDKTVTYGVFLRRGTVCAVNPALEILREYYPGTPCRSRSRGCTRRAPSSRIRSRFSPTPARSRRWSNWRR